MTETLLNYYTNTRSECIYESKNIHNDPKEFVRIVLINLLKEKDHTYIFEEDILNNIELLAIDNKDKRYLGLFSISKKLTDLFDNEKCYIVSSKATNSLLLDYEHHKDNMSPDVLVLRPNGDKYECLVSVWNYEFRGGRPSSELSDIEDSLGRIDWSS